MTTATIDLVTFLQTLQKKNSKTTTNSVQLQGVVLNCTAFGHPPTPTSALPTCSDSLGRHVHTVDNLCPRRSPFFAAAHVS